MNELLNDQSIDDFKLINKYSRDDFIKHADKQLGF